MPHRSQPTDGDRPSRNAEGSPGADRDQPGVVAAIRFTSTAPHLDNDACRIDPSQVDSTILPTLGSDFIERVSRHDERMIEWLRVPEHAEAFALNPLYALDRFHAPIDGTLIDELRNASIRMQSTREPGSFRIRLIWVGADEGER
jgi:hypothetical protein